MKIGVCVVSENADFIDYVGDQKEAIIPSETLRRLPSKASSIQVSGFKYDGSEKPGDLLGFVLGRSGGCDAFVLVCEKHLHRLVARLTIGALTISISPPNDHKKFGNYMRSKMASAMKTLSQVLKRFEDGGDRLLLCLPMRNFAGVELQNISGIIANAAGIGDLSAALDSELRGLRRRVRPRKKSSYRTRYVVDDRTRFFVFGKEAHARYETGYPHDAACAFGANFRFGVRIDCEHHYNVSEGEGDRTSISGDFLDCHDNVAHVDRSSHLNMFSNDFFC